MPFKALQIIDPILKSLQEEGYKIPTPIQQRAIPLVLAGKDLLGVAQTGTGKTAAFAIPILQLLSEHAGGAKHHKIRCLIITPTRELAIQIEESFKNYGRHLKIRHAVVFGGVSQHAQTSSLKQGVDVLVATPGRLLDLMNQGFISLKDIEIFVLDEADRMLDMGFIHDVKKIIAKLPTKRQTLFFSATMPPEITSLASTILHHPERVDITPVATTAETVQQFVCFTDKGNKNNLLLHMLSRPDMKSCLVFTRTKHGADKVTKFLVKNGVKAEAIHGNKSQNNRQRALTNFKSRAIRVLVATDIAARGIDVDNLEHVINYEIPNIPETYVHRIGRTGRAGAEGIAISFCDNEEKAYLRDIEKLTKKKIPVIDDHPYKMTNESPVRSEEPASKNKPAHSRGRGDNRNAGRRQDAKRPEGKRNDEKTQGSTGTADKKKSGGNWRRKNKKSGNA
jgi:ATP-dependent RNA helicase RhlE